MKFLSGIGAMFALAVVALATTLTSCEKEDFNVSFEPINAQAEIRPVVLYVDANSTTNVTGDANITYDPEGPIFTGSPSLSAKVITVTATYKGIKGEAKVNVPALQAGQYLTLSTTIILQAAAPGPEEPVNAKAEVNPTVLYIADGVTTDVTDKAELVFEPANDGKFEGEPELAATTSKITATYAGESATITVDVPSLLAGQVATMSPTIVLQKKSEVINAKAEIRPIVLYLTNNVVLDVTALSDCEIEYDPASVFEGTPSLEGTTSKVTATYKGISSTVSVNVPALAAGQYVTLTPTLLLVAEEEEEPGGEDDPSFMIVPVTKVTTTSTTSEDAETNVTDFWWNIDATYVIKEGTEICDYDITGLSDDEQSFIEDFVSTLSKTYKETKTVVQVPLYSHSMTKASVTYTIVTTDYEFYRMTTTATRASQYEKIATVTTKGYSTSVLTVETNLQIPGHDAPSHYGHGYDHSHGHGSGNAGGGIVIPD